jgi:hypothetical protein
MESEDTTELTTDITETVSTDDTTAETAENTIETFSRSYVEKLRDENAKLRVRAQNTDELRARLHTELVKATGKLADPNDFPYSDAYFLNDPEALNTALDELIAEKPHLRSRTPKGDVGQGNRGPADAPVNLIELLKTRV